MSISDTDLSKERKKNLVAYGFAALFCFCFQMIYNSFSHGVSSCYMTFAFLIPILSGGINTLSFSLFKRDTYTFRQLINGAAIWLTFGSLFNGALEIYGTTNSLIAVFPVVGGLHILSAVITLFIKSGPAT